MKSDGGLYDLFKKYLPPVIHWQRIETGGTGRGIPDTNFCYEYEGWIEFKKTSKWGAGLRPEQVGWIDRRTRVGGRVWIAVRRTHTGGERKGCAQDQLWLVPGRMVIQLHQGGLNSVPVVPEEGGPSKWDWKVVAQKLGLPGGVIGR